MDIFNKALLDKAIEDINFIEVFAKINPNAHNATEQLENLIVEKVSALYTLVLDKFSDVNEKFIFQNMIAVAYHDPLHLMIVWRMLQNAAKKNKFLESEIIRLEVAIHKSTLEKTGLKSLVKQKITNVPTIEVIKGITPALNFRYWLATRKANEINTVNLIRFPQINKKISRLAWQREVKNFINDSLDSKKIYCTINKSEYQNLAVSEKMLLVSDDELFNKLASGIGNREMELEDLNTILKNQNKLRPVLFSIIYCIQKREFDKANELLNLIDIEHYHGEIVSKFAPIFRKKITDYVYPKIKHWQHLNASSLIKLKKLCINEEICSYFGSSANQISKLLSEKKLKITQIHPKDLTLLRQTWTNKEEYQLIKNGIYNALAFIPEDIAIELLPQLLEDIQISEHSQIIINRISSLISNGNHFNNLLPHLIEGKYPVLTELFKSKGSYHRHKFSNLVVKYFGSITDISCVDHSSLEHAKELIDYIDKPDLVSPLGYKSSLAKLLTSNLLKYLPGLRPYSNEQLNNFHSWANLAFSFTTCCSEAGKYLAESINSNQASILLNDQHFPMNLWERIINYIQDEKFQLLLRSQNLSRMNSSEFLKNIRERPSLIDYVGIKNKRPFKDYKDDLDRIATIICIRKSPKSLKKIQGYWSKLEFKEAVLSACEYLPPRSRQRGYLSLISHLDKSATLPLAAILSSSKKSGEPGNKLNHLYSSFEIPKKNGKKRTITAPSQVLKKVQKSVLINLLNDIKVHPAANGFCIGKSIVSNAAPHTKKKIVVNCDISNCFPSVSWSLIHRSLKISLEKQLGIAAVSLLTDICSKDGALPMGAPTSPVLLNIILYKTDEILFRESSKLNCSYTRYADDLTFSGDENAIKLIGLAKFSLNKIGLEIDPIKTNIFRRGRRQSVTGLVVNDGISVNKKYRKLVRAATHKIEQNKEPFWLGEPVTKSSIRGRIDFINSVNKKYEKKV